MAIALIVLTVPFPETAIGELYTAEVVVGVVPSVV
jgi:hypothetical protein